MTKKSRTGKTAQK